MNQFVNNRYHGCGCCCRYSKARVWRERDYIRLAVIFSCRCRCWGWIDSLFPNSLLFSSIIILLQPMMLILLLLSFFFFLFFRRFSSLAPLLFSFIFRCSLSLALILCLLGARSFHLQITYPAINLMRERPPSRTNKVESRLPPGLRTTIYR